MCHDMTRHSKGGVSDEREAKKRRQGDGETESRLIGEFNTKECSVCLAAVLYNTGINHFSASLTVFSVPFLRSNVVIGRILGQ